MENGQEGGGNGEGGFLHVLKGGGGGWRRVAGEAGRVDWMDMMECLGGHEVTVFFLTDGHLIYLPVQFCSVPQLVKTYMHVSASDLHFCRT